MRRPFSPPLADCRDSPLPGPYLRSVTYMTRYVRVTRQRLRGSAVRPTSSEQITFTSAQLVPPNSVLVIPAKPVWGPDPPIRTDSKALVVLFLFDAPLLTVTNPPLCVKVVIFLASKNAVIVVPVLDPRRHRTRGLSVLKCHTSRARVKSHFRFPLTHPIPSPSSTHDIPLFDSSHLPLTQRSSLITPSESTQWFSTLRCPL